MFYVEKWINGKLYFKNTPDCDWVELTKNQYSQRLEMTNKLAASLKDYLQAIKDQVDQHGKISIVKGDITYTAIENILK